jgi:hypothetical protein
MLRLALASALAAALLALGCASQVSVARTEAPPLAGRYALRAADAAPQARPERWLVIAIAPEVPGRFDADVPDLAERTEAALRRAGGFDVAGRAVLPAPPDAHELAARAAAHGADGALFARIHLRELVRRTDLLRYLASTASFGIFPFTVAEDELSYVLELVAVNAGTGGAVAAASAERDVRLPHTLWQTAEGGLFGWDVGEAIGGARARRRALDAETADVLLAESVPALLPRGFAQVLRSR